MNCVLKPTSVVRNQPPRKAAVPKTWPGTFVSQLVVLLSISHFFYIYN